MDGYALRLFVLAGEPSGDALGADLVRRLREKRQVEVIGVGGPALAGEGLNSLYPMHDLSVMGVTDVVVRLPKLLWRIEQTARAVQSLRPDIVVLIDAQVFSALVATRLRRRGWSSPIVLYVAPSVWGRAPERAAKIRPLFDEVMAVLPFEPAVMRRLGGPPTVFVGHPALRHPRMTRPQVSRGPVILMPGSRLGELRRHLPLFRDVSERISRHAEVTELALLTLPHLVPAIEPALRGWTVRPELVADAGRRAELLASSLMAIVAMGTATLEVAMASVPMVAAYAMDRVQARVYARLGRPFASLPNIVLGKMVVPEVMMETGNGEHLLDEADRLVANADLRALQSVGFEELRQVMETGVPGDPRAKPEERVLALVQRSSFQRATMGT